MKRLSLALALAALAVQSALAQNYGFLQDSPASRMNKADVAMMMKNFDEALTRNADGHTSAWLNSATGASGTATPLSTTTEKGMTCRRVEVFNAAGGLTNRAEYRACKTAGGWKLAN
jgi:hypothetical protein